MQGEAATGTRVRVYAIINGTPTYHDEKGL